MEAKFYEEIFRNRMGEQKERAQLAIRDGILKNKFIKN